MAGPPYPISNLQAPVGQIPLDSVTGAAGCGVMASYSVLSTVGTGTQATGRSSAGGIFYGLQAISTGTGFAIAVYDVVGTVTNQLVGLTTATAIGQQIFASPQGVGVRFLGNLVYVTTGTAGQFNSLWD